MAKAKEVKLIAGSIPFLYTAVMQSTASTPKEYIDSLPEDRKPVMKKLRAAIKKNLPKGFKETMQYGMISYVVPHSTYPDGYHCNPEDALPFASLASQKNHIAVYHSGVYAIPELLAWFEKEYGQRVEGKLDMGKSCIRFKNPKKVPVELIGELMTKLTPQDWIKVYEREIKK